MPAETVPAESDSREDVDAAESAKEDRPMAISIDKVVGNYNPSSVPSSKPPAPPSRPTNASNAKPIPAVKNNTSKPVGGSNTKASNHQGYNNKPPTFKTNSKVSLNRPPMKVPQHQPNKPMGLKPSSRRPASGGAEEDLDPAMYLDPTITITLINNEREKKNGGGGVKAASNEISSSDLQVSPTFF